MSILFVQILINLEMVLTLTDAAPAACNRCTTRSRVAPVSMMSSTCASSISKRHTSCGNLPQAAGMLPACSEGLPCTAASRSLRSPPGSLRAAAARPPGH